MAFSHDLSEELRAVLKKIYKKDRLRWEIVFKKIAEITSQDEKTIDHYKNLKHDLSGFKRVHIDKSFVLLFHVDKNKKHVLFYKLYHHNNIYKK